MDLLVEGQLDRAVGIRLLRECKLPVGTVYGLRGFGYIRSKLAEFDRAVRGHRLALLGLVDLMDTGLACPVSVVNQWLPDGQAGCTVFRVVVREIESWIMGDQYGLAKFLSVSAGHLPSDPEASPDPKADLIAAARKSSKRDIRESLVPPAEATASEGPLYTTRLAGFVRAEWNVQAARARCDSLDRALRAIDQSSDGCIHYESGG